MRLTPEILRDFLSVLPQYEALSLTDRRALASIERPSQSCSSYVLRDSLQTLIAACFLLPPADNGRCSVEPARQEFLRTLRVLRGHSVFQNPGQTSFERYLTAHLTVDERVALRGGALTGYGDRNRLLFGQIATSDWPEQFLSAQSVEWESPYLVSGAPALFVTSELLSRAKRFVRWLMAHGGRAAMRDLPRSPEDPAPMSEVLHACMRYALVFATLDSDTMDAIVGLWPGTTIKPEGTSAATSPPRCVVPTETISPCFLVEDVTALLVACATEPLRLRSSDQQLFTKTVRDLAATLRPLPQWVDDAFGMDPETRLKDTVWYVQSFRLVEQKGFRSAHMTVSALGRQWLGLPLGDRLRVLIDGVLDHKQSVAAFQSFQGAQMGATGSRLYVSTRLKPPPDIPAAILQRFRSLPGEGFFLIEEIMAFCRTANPLLEILSRDKTAYFGDGYVYGYAIRGEDNLQKLWTDTLRGFLRTRFVPLGGVRVGRGKEGLSIAITPVGRYFLGETKHWEWEAATADSQVIVQPNFEVTFLGEAAAAEAEIGRFAERRGRQIGALFQITKKSIFAAAVAGMTVETVLATLERVCTREVPANVRREIQGWFAQCRKVSFESAMLIRCPDRETALRVLGLAKDCTVALSDTVLEYRDPGGKQRSWLIKKLKEMGVIVSVQESDREKQWGVW